MTYKNLFANTEFFKKYEKVKTNIEQYLTDKEYELNKLTIEDLITWKDIGKTRIIETTEKCPSEIKNILTEFIKEGFPNTNENKY
jgi:hypothetical protein